MSHPGGSELQGGSTRPYLIRALHDWCTDNGFTPYIAVFVDETVDVPRDYVKNGEIVLNVSYDATSELALGNEAIQFKARFAGVVRSLHIPIDHVIAIYARENGQGMAFPVPTSGASASAPAEESEPAAAGGRRLASVPSENGSVSPEAPPEPPNGGGPAGRPALKRIK